MGKSVTSSGLSNAKLTNCAWGSEIKAALRPSAVLVLLIGRSKEKRTRFVGGIGD
jgi:hypothetical protein